MLGLLLMDILSNQPKHVLTKEKNMSDDLIIQEARYATDTGDFTKIEINAKNFLAYAQKRWAPHAAQDEKCRIYDLKPWWKKLFSKEPYGGAMMNRCRDYENFVFAQALVEAVKERDVRSFTDRR